VALEIKAARRDPGLSRGRNASRLAARQGALLGTIVAAFHQFRTEVARFGSRSDDFEVFGGDTGCAVTGVVVAGVEIFQVAAERGLGRFAEPGECFQSWAVMNPVELDRFRNREWKFELH
jgi:hypothetical protein